jgi:hypothetical protein
MMSVHIFLTLQISISSLTQASPDWGSGSDIVETHESIVLPISFGVTKGFRAILVNFFIVGLMLPYEAFVTSVMYQARQVPAPSDKSPV